MGAANVSRVRRCNAIQRAVTVAFLAVCTIPFIAHTASSRSASAREYDIKASMLSRFASFVEWPERSMRSADNTFAICVLGRDPFGSRLEREFEGRKVRGRSVSIQRGSRLRSLGTCHVLFVSLSEKKSLSVILRELAGKTVLTISDIDDFVARGGMIQFKKSGSRVQFDISKTAAQKARLKINPQLLKLASNVRGR